MFDIGTAQWTVRALGRLALTFAVLVGMLILAGGEDRFGTQSYANALLYPGAPWSWGIVAFATGLIGLFASSMGWFRVVWWCLMLLATWSLFFAISFAQSAVNDPQASTTGIAVYGYVAISSLILGLTHRRTAHLKG